MIHDHFSRIALYRPLSRNIARAIDYLTSIDLDALSPGRHEVEPDRVFATLYETQTLLNGARWESHRKYIDLQLMLRGHERQKVADIEQLSGATPYAAEKDVIFYEKVIHPLTVDLRVAQFVFYFPHDGHLPMIAPIHEAAIRKLVLKIAVEER